MSTKMKEERETEIDIRHVIGIILSKLPIIILVSVILAIGTFIYFKLMVSPVYQSSERILVMSSKTDDKNITSSDMSVYTSLSKDYTYILTSRPVLEQVIADSNLDINVSEMSKKIKVSALTDSRILEIVVSDTKPAMTKKIVDAVAEAGVSRIMSVVKTDNATVLHESYVPSKPVSPNCTRNAIIGFAIVFIIGCAIVVVRYLLDDTIKTQDDVENYLGLSVLGLIPIMETDANNDIASSKKVSIDSSSRNSHRHSSIASGSEDRESGLKGGRKDA